MGRSDVLTHPWRCSRCAAVVFIPDDGKIKGGVCTQQRRGCDGEIARMTDEEAGRIRCVMALRGMSEQAWLTLVFSGKGATC